jgi:anthranilate/para-aminobenzoate synthase component I
LSRRFEAYLSLSRAELETRIADLPGAFLMCDEGRVFAAAFPDRRSAAVDPQSEALPSDDEHLRAWPEWVGVLPYEAFRGNERRLRAGGEDKRLKPPISSPIWQRYPAVAEVEDEHISVRGESAQAVETLAAALRRGRVPSGDRTAELTWAEPPEDGAVHRHRIEVALERIARGELYQVNLARRFKFRSRGSALHLLSSLGPMARAPYAAALDLGEVQVVSTSPELFLQADPDGLVITRPIKGTRPRSSDPKEDERLKEELHRSEKEQAELAMVIDLERNDLGRLALPGTVSMTEPPHVVSHPTVHHREATVQGRLPPGYSRARLLDAMMPSGSVTGAPKLAAMDLIAELESERRGLYTGALGYVTYGGNLRLSMAIRVLTVRGGEAHYFAGGGIVADSDATLELEETIWKAEQLRALVSF